jgi:hypothetical protein
MLAHYQTMGGFMEMKFAGKVNSPENAAFFIEEPYHDPNDQTAAIAVTVHLSDSGGSWANLWLRLNTTWHRMQDEREMEISPRASILQGEILRAVQNQHIEALLSDDIWLRAAFHGLQEKTSQIIKRG